MSSYKTVHGIAHIEVGGERESLQLNEGPGPNPKVAEAFFRSGAKGGYSPINYARPMACPNFNRYSKLRYLKPTAYRLFGTTYWTAASNSLYAASYLSPTNSDRNHFPWDMSRRNSYASFGTFAETIVPMSVGMLGARLDVLQGLTGAGDTAYPDTSQGYPFVSCVDLPGTIIGNVFKHPAGAARKSIFNEVGQVALSQGQTTFSGVYDPDENLAYSMAYRVYITKSGGTGALDSTDYTNGVVIDADTMADGSYTFVAGDWGKYIRITSGNNAGYEGYINAVAGGQADVIPATLVADAGPFNWSLSTQGFGSGTAADGNSYTFSDSLYTFVAGDIGKYLILRTAANTRTLLITALNGGKAETDADDINDPMVSEAGIDWELRTGPIAEYFWQRRPYYKGDTWGTGAADTSDIHTWGLVHSGTLYHLRGWVEDIPTSNSRVATKYYNTRTLHDRGACWWSLSYIWGEDPTSYSVPKSYGLRRWKHLSCEPFDLVYEDGDITNMPANIERWRDMDIDANSKLQISWYDDSAIGACLAKVNPYPDDGAGPDALNPDCEATWTKQTGGGDATGVVTNNILGVRSDNENEVTYLVHGPDGTTDGGVSYNDGGKGRGVDYAYADDGAVFTDETTGANNSTDDDVTLLPTTPAVNDAYYFGNDSPFTSVVSRVSTVAASTPVWTLAWEYWNGAWTALTFGNQEMTNLTTDVPVAGTYTNEFNAPSDWATTTVNGQSAYWVRLRVTAYTSGSGPLGAQVWTGPVMHRVHIAQAITGTDDWDVDGTGLLVTNGTGDATVLSDLAAGDWIQFGDESRGREVEAVIDNQNFRLKPADARAGVASALTMVKGLFTTARSSMRWTTTYTSYNADKAGPPPLAFDAQDRLHWIASDVDTVVRFDRANGLVTSLTSAEIQGSKALGNLQTMIVSRFTGAAGSGSSLFQDDVWVGSQNTGVARIYGWETKEITQFADAGGGQVTVTCNGHGLSNGDSITITDTSNYNGVFTVANVAANTFEITDTWVADDGRGIWDYWNVTRYAGDRTDNFPTECDLSANAGSYSASMFQDPNTENIYILQAQGTGTNSPTFYLVQADIPDADPDFGLALYLGGYYAITGNSTWGWSYVPYGAQFDDIGLGTHAIFGASERNVEDANVAAIAGKFHNPGWVCFRWNGSQWVKARLNSQDALLDFEGIAGGPYVNNVPAEWVGSGVRRVHEYADHMDGGIYIQFDQAGGATSQTDEYVVDETITTTGIIGRYKDNTMTFSWGCDFYRGLAVTRLDEPTRAIESPWTANLGVDGGFVSSSNLQAMPVYTRGVAEFTYQDCTAPNGIYVQSTQQTMTTDSQYMAAMRVDDEDDTFAWITGGGTTDLTLVNNVGVGEAVSATYAFVDPDDIGKTIRTENTADALDTTSKVITAITGAGVGNTAVLDSPWSTPGGPYNWRLRDIPPVSYVAGVFNYLETRIGMFYQDYTLLSSKDGGLTWDTVKAQASFQGNSYNDNVEDYIDPGIMWNVARLSMEIGNNFWGYADNNFGGRTIIFDLTGVDESERRRTHWKIVRTDTSAVNRNAFFGSIVLLDADRSPMTSANTKVTDRDDPLFVALNDSSGSETTCNGVKLVAEEGTGATGVDQGYGFPFTDVIQDTGATFYEQSGADMDVVANGSTIEVTDPGPFIFEDEGKRLRVVNADVYEPVGPPPVPYNGWLVINTVVDDHTIIVDRVFNSQANGSITTFTDQGGGIVRMTTNPAHGLTTGDIVTVSNAGSYNGYYYITVIDATNFDVTVAYDAGPTSGNWDQGQLNLTWQMTKFGYGDRVRFTDTASEFTNLRRPLRTVTWNVVDVPSTTTIQVDSASVPLSVSSDYVIERDFEEALIETWKQNAAWIDQISCGYDRRLAVMAFSEPAEFLEIDSNIGASVATTPADGDKDGWEDRVQLSTVLDTAAVVGDWLWLMNTATGYQRYFQIKDITRTTAITDLVVNLDEITPSVAFDMWKVLRKRDYKWYLPVATITVDETIP